MTCVIYLNLFIQFCYLAPQFDTSLQKAYRYVSTLGCLYYNQFSLFQSFKFYLSFPQHYRSCPDAPDDRDNAAYRGIAY